MLTSDEKIKETTSYDLISRYERQCAYHRNHRGEEQKFRQHLPDILSRLALVKAHPDWTNLGGRSSRTFIVNLLKLIRRSSEYMLSVNRDCDFAIEYNEWALTLYRDFSEDIRSGVEEDVIKLENHLAFAYYFLHEMGQPDKTSLSKARHLLRHSLHFNSGRYPELMGYAHCVSGQIAILNGTYERAKNHLIQAYRFYTGQPDSFLPDAELLALETRIPTLKTTQEAQESSRLYQRMIVLCYYADNEVRTGVFEFAQRCYPICLAFIQEYCQGDTLQTGDIYYRLGRLMLALSQREKALSFFRQSLAIYRDIVGEHHKKTTEIVATINIFQDNSL